MTTFLKQPTRITAQYLVNNNIGGYRTNVPQTEPGWCICCGILPNAPDRVICLLDSPAQKSQGRLMSGEVISHPPIQVRVRAEDRDLAWEKISQIFNLMEGARNEAVVCDEVSFTIQHFVIDSVPLFMGNDAGTDRPNFVFDILLIAKELTDAST